MDVTKKFEKNKINYITIEDRVIAEFVRKLNYFLMALGPDIENNQEKFKFLIKSVRFEVLTNPLPLNYILDFELLSFLIEDINSTKSLIKEIKLYAEELNNSLLNVYEAKTTGLLKCLREEIILYSSYEYCVVTKKSLSQKERNLLISKFDSKNLVILSEKEFLKERRFFDILIFIGNERLFHFSINTTSRTRQLYFISYGHFINKGEDTSLFIDWDREKLTTMYANTDFSEETIKYHYQPKDDRASLEPREIIIEDNDVDVNIISTMILEDLNIANKVDSISANLFYIALDKFLFLGVDSNIDTFSNGVFIRKKAKDIEIGDYIIINELESNKMIELYANEKFMENGILKDRKNNLAYKEYLRKASQKKGIDALVEYFHRRGLTSINTNKINHLLKESSFKLQNKKEFWEFLLILTKGDEEKASKIFISSRRLQAYHIKAGKEIREHMRKELTSHSNELERNKSLRLKGIPDMIVNLYLVDKIDKKTHVVPRGLTGKINKIY